MGAVPACRNAKNLEKKAVRTSNTSHRDETLKMEILLQVLESNYLER